MEEEETVADDIKCDNLENEDALTGVGSSLQASGPFPFHGWEGMSEELAEAGHSDDAPRIDEGRTYRWPTLGANRGRRLCRCAQGASGGGRLRRRAPRAKGSEPLYPGAGGGLKTTLPRRGGAEV